MTWVAGVLILGCISILFGGQFLAMTPIMAFPVAILAALWCASSLSLTRRDVILPAVTACAVIALSLWVSVSVYDTSWDGQGYQYEGTQAVADGWDIYRQNHPEGAIQPLWLGFYSKGPWVMSGALVKLFDHPEIGKAINPVVMAAVLLCSPAILGFFTEKRWLMWAISGLLALNPITIAQLFTYYVDGQLACYVTLLTLMLMGIWERPSRALWVVLTLAAILLIAVKLNGVLFLTAAAGLYALQYWLKRRKGGLTLLMCGVIAYVIGIGLVSWNPFYTQYIRQTVEQQDPFYPTTWQALTFIEKNTPPQLLGKGWTEKFLTSLFARYGAGGENALKLPFMVYPEEALWVADARWAGFGPLFSGAIILIFTSLIIAPWKTRTLPIPEAIGRSMGAMLVILILDAWWARYIPQLWLGVTLGMFTLILVQQPWARRIASLGLVVLALNVAFLSVWMVNKTTESSTALQLSLQEAVAHSIDAPIHVNFDGFVLIQAHFDRVGVRYVEAQMLPCSDDVKRIVRSSQVKYCLP